MKKHRVLIYTFTVAALALSALFVWDSTGNSKTNQNSLSNGTEKNHPGIEKKTEDTRTVVLEKTSFHQSGKTTRYPGTVHACKESRLAFRVGGPLIRVNVKAGDVVKKDEVLMKIDPQDFKDQLRVLNARLKGSLSQLETAKQDFQRMKQLFGQKVIPQADFDHAVNAKNTAAASVAQIRAQLAIAEHQLDYTSLRAPYDGIVISQMIENHEMVSAGQIVVGLHDITTLEIRINVPENEMITHPLKTGRPAVATFPSIGDKEFRVELKEWSTSSDRSSNTFAVTFSMPHPGDIQILPGMTAEIDWSEQTGSARVMTIPVKAMVTDISGASYVWSFDPATSKASKTPIIPGKLIGTSRIIVKNGLDENTLIVTDGVDFITEDMILTATLKNNDTDSENNPR